MPRAFGAQAGRVLVVGGGPVETRESVAVAATWLPLVIAFVLLVSLALLTVAFRSIALSLTAIAVNRFSVAV